jgi:hypothetical protein
LCPERFYQLVYFDNRRSFSFRRHNRQSSSTTLNRQTALPAL